jgi:hypothetical protein
MSRSARVNRRDFLFQAGVGTATALLGPQSLAGQEAADNRSELTIFDTPAGRVIPPDFTGLSYELAQLTEPEFFSAANHDLVAYFRLLSKRGVLRLGGNTSEFCWLQVNAATPAPKLHIPVGSLDTNWMPHRLFAIPREAIGQLGGFLEATGWRLIYGVNFGNSTPERAAAEAAYVAGKLEKYLEFFQIGNEPDFYRDANNGTRPPGWDFADYAAEWLKFAEVIQTKVSDARFGGPDVGASSDWIARFGEQVAPKLEGRLAALTGHYYAEGPPNDPRVTTERLLAGDARISSQMRGIEAVRRAHSLSYRMTEGNSCYRGGKPAMSNAFASALWAGDYMLQLASLGCAGVNLHGGDSRFLPAGPGGHTPGLEVASQPQSMPSGFYTPIASEKGGAVHAMPVYYGMMLANALAGTSLMRTELQSTANATAYAGLARDGYRVAVFNKSTAQEIALSIRTPKRVNKATGWRLLAPALDSTDGMTLAGAEIEAHGVWAPKVVEAIPVNDGVTSLRVPAASAALVFLE